MFPFASHATHGYSLAYAARELRAAGALARRYGHRLTAHPGQYTQLASPREEVVRAAVRELECECLCIMDGLGARALILGLGAGRSL